MSSFVMKRIKNTARIFGFLLMVSIVAGCAAQKTEIAQPAVQNEMQPEPKAIEETPPVVPADRLLNAVSVEPKKQGIEVTLQGNQKFVYTSIKQEFPFGIAVYLLETKIADDLQTLLPDNRSIGDLIVRYADKEKTTVKVEILLKEDLNYDVIQTDTNLKVALSGGSPGSSKDALQTGLTDSSDSEILEPASSESQTLEPVSSQTALNEQQESIKTVIQEPVVIPDTTATMTNIEFNTMETGNSDILVKTNQPVRYDITQGDAGKLYLNLYNTIVPDHHKRPLLTRYFKSAVERLIPVQVPGPKKNSKIEIIVRDQVPYRVVQNNNTISLFFEPSRIVPPVFSKAKKTLGSGDEIQSIIEEDQADGTGTAVAEAGKSVEAKKKTMEEEIFGPQKKYTGEKIKLDFYETDIKNVIRILRSVGGLNFAIDKDVQGKVTLTLDNPVPWDQVLDLVLKMNDLGQKKEGNVIRIATLETIKKEEKLVQDAIAARKKTMEQKVSFEPLVTEYIPINYSDADTDIKPHIDQILTKERGKISVDKRTNMIIITDTQAKVDQAREIIYRLDKVTPQIMIEAKVVEVSKDFSRELGLGLSVTNAPPTTTTDFTVALNNPVANAVSAGSFNFFRLFGSSLTSLNAQIAASETKGDVKVVSSPRILTLDNKSAKIKQGLEFAYLERDDTGGSSVKFKNIDLLLEVTPHVTPDKRISMNVYLTKNDIDSVTNGVPSLSTNEAETELLVNNNDTIIIGGIVKTTDNKSTSGTPLLSGIPILGRLFRTDINSDKRNELLIFITPSIVQLEQKRNTITRTD